MAHTHLNLYTAAHLLFFLLPLVKALPSNSPIEARDGSYTYLACYTDAVAGQRTLGGPATADDTMTVQKCSSFCTKYNHFGVEYGRECYCGNTIQSQALAVDRNECSFACSGNPLEVCGAGNRMNIYSNLGFSSPKPATLVDHVYLGCFIDNGDRVLPDKPFASDTMTAAFCAQHCQGYTYFGTQWSRECYCGNVAPQSAAPESECSFTCSGSDAELCGAGMRLSVYGPPVVSSLPGTTPSQGSTPSPVSPAAAATVSGYVYQGCYTDNLPQRVLTGDLVRDPTMSLEKCASFCSTSHYTYFGVEFTGECYCGMALDTASAKQSEVACAMKCGGDGTEICGDANRISVYALPQTSTIPVVKNLATVGGFYYSSCWVDNVDGRRSLSAKDYRADDMTAEKCASFCQGYSYFGLEYSRECYCGNTVGGFMASEKDCGHVCVGDSSQWCGGGDRLSLYSINPPIISSSSFSMTSTSSLDTASVATSGSTSSTQNTSSSFSSLAVPTTSTGLESFATTTSPTAFSSSETTGSLSTSTSSIFDSSGTPSIPSSTASSTSSISTSPTSTFTTSFTSSVSISSSSSSISSSSTSSNGIVSSSTTSSAAAAASTCNPGYRNDLTATFSKTFGSASDLQTWAVTTSSQTTYSYVQGDANALAYNMSFASVNAVRSTKFVQTFNVVRGATYQVSLRCQLGGTTSQPPTAAVQLAAPSTTVQSVVTQSADSQQLQSWQTVTAVFTPALDAMTVTISATSPRSAVAWVIFDRLEIKMITPTTNVASIVNGEVLTFADVRSGAVTFPSWLKKPAEGNIVYGAKPVFGFASPGYNGAETSRSVWFNNQPPLTANSGGPVFYFAGYGGDGLKYQNYDGGRTQVAGYFVMDGCEQQWQTIESGSFTPVYDLLIQAQFRCPFSLGLNATFWLDNIEMVPVAG
ncbi:hypothetical protein CTAM01_09431 [Colletotrichum tamarilloi]|uniref:WSC domain-containing protein n=1 Tax=Colletotrichum tamarilloi TaxID=1209934 RepID=A0ABQ9R3D6_9PEZI|nr:uncharacterized protein CTAM01_09431 [Colletotrichum tamarilloi]KAK1493287.1 hypothetical protein CTAM01_09431 [Colletotrichum tamarilloi]